LPPSSRFSDDTCAPGILSNSRLTLFFFLSIAGLYDFLNLTTVFLASLLDPFLSRGWNPACCSLRHSPLCSQPKDPLLVFFSFIWHAGVFEGDSSFFTLFRLPISCPLKVVSRGAFFLLGKGFNPPFFYPAFQSLSKQVLSFRTLFNLTEELLLLDPLLASPSGSFSGAKKETANGARRFFFFSPFRFFCRKSFSLTIFL